MDLLFEVAVEAAGELISEGINAVATSKKEKKDQKSSKSQKSQKIPKSQKSQEEDKDVN